MFHGSVYGPQGRKEIADLMDEMIRVAKAKEINSENVVMDVFGRAAQALREPPLVYVGNDGNEQGAIKVGGGISTAGPFISIWRDAESHGMPDGFICFQSLHAIRQICYVLETLIERIESGAINPDTPLAPN